MTEPTTTTNEKSIVMKRKYRPLIEEDKLVLFEKPNLFECRRVWKHPDIAPAQKLLILRYCESALEAEDGMIKITYEKEGPGRYWVKESKGNRQWRSTCTQMNSRVRAVLFEKTEVDIDIVNCHPNIVLLLNKQHEVIDLPYTKKYCAERLRIFADCEIDQDAINDWNKENHKNKTKYDLLKELSTQLLFGAKYDKKEKRCPPWEEKYGLRSDDYTLCEDLTKYMDEINIILSIFPNLPAFADTKKETYKREKAKVLKKHPLKEDMKKNDKREPFDEDKFKIHNGKYLSIILQQAESEILYDAMKIVDKNKFYITSYAYDGFQILKDERIEDLLIELNNESAENITFIAKPFNKPFDTSELSPDLFFDRERFALYRTPYNRCYQDKKRYFEEFHFKTSNPVSFYRIGHRCHQQFNHTNFKNDCKNLRSMQWITTAGIWAECDFFAQWEKDEEMRNYNKCGYYPPPLKTPFNSYNLFPGFPIEDEPLDMSADTGLIHRHFKYVANHRKALYEYYLNYYAHIVQFPGKKLGVCLIFMGNQGAGKSLIAEEIMKCMIGMDAIMITSEPNKFCGRFADILGKLLIVLNEASGASTFQISEILKDRITAQTFPREKKGIDIEPDARCTENYNFTTNGVNSAKIPHDDRRFLPNEVDNSIANDPGYFDPTWMAFQNKRIMRKFYEELKTRDLTNFVPQRDRPMTPLRASMMSMNLNPYDAFVVWLYQKQINIGWWRPNKENQFFQDYNEMYEPIVLWDTPELRGCQNDYTRENAFNDIMMNIRNFKLESDGYGNDTERRIKWVRKDGKVRWEVYDFDYRAKPKAGEYDNPWYNADWGDLNRLQDWALATMTSNRYRRKLKFYQHAISNHEKPIIKFSGKKLFSLFKQFYQEDKRSEEKMASATYFGTHIKRVPGIGNKREGAGEVYWFAPTSFSKYCRHLLDLKLNVDKLVPPQDMIPSYKKDPNYKKALTI